MKTKNNTYESTSNQVHIRVTPRYEANESNPAIGKFIYSYHITLTNENPFTVQLLQRTWHIVDSIQERREIRGKGVVGQQPVLAPGESFSYTSWCPLHSPIGKMFGSYDFLNLVNSQQFEVEIPEFLLVSDFKLN
ncbi:MAG: Co2+/Mg2+ efflux protein ApaG [Saprospiraceae bacterium]|jgi:ApaG protein|nr:Co2+/Mg2+ efflux protein ApaG [Saprospiraceae bacterium]